MPTDAERVGAPPPPPAPHFHNPPNAGELAKIAVMAQSGVTPTAADEAFLNSVRPKAVATGDDHTVAVIDTLLA